MTFAPASLLAARTYLAGHGVPLAALGIVGDAAHGNEGYHVGWDRLRYGYAGQDYSVSDSPRDGHPTNAASALDIGGFPRLRELSVWLVAQCRAGVADTRDIREIIYTPDGRVVRRWDRLGFRSGGDDSHLWHTHISYFRDSENRDKTALFRRFFEGETMVQFDQTDDGFGNGKENLYSVYRILLSLLDGRETVDNLHWCGTPSARANTLHGKLDELLARPAVTLDEGTIGLIAQQLSAVVGTVVVDELAARLRRE